MLARPPTMALIVDIVALHRALINREQSTICLELHICMELEQINDHRSLKSYLKEQSNVT